MAPTNTPIGLEVKPTPRKRFVKPIPYVRKQPKIGRNDKCPCGSGKKNKKCHKATL